MRWETSSRPTLSTSPSIVLAEVWLSGEEGYLIHTTKGAHKNQVVKGEAKRR